MKNLSLSQRQIILGGLLGDASLNKKSQYIEFSQGEKQEKYLAWKYSFFNIDNKIKNVYNTFHNKKFLRYYFNIYRKNMDDEFLSFLFKNLYSNEGRKKISFKYLESLNPLGLAIWWMDDGNISLSKENRYGKLSTHCFNYEEHIIIQKYFKETWGINVSIKKEKEIYYFIRLNATELKKLIKIIYKYVIQIPNMAYKVDMCYKYDNCIGEDFIKEYNEIKKVINENS